MSEDVTKLHAFSYAKFERVTPKFERVTDLNLLEYAFNVIQNWETDALQLFLFDDAYFLLAVTVDKEMKVAGQGWLTSRRFWPATGPY